MSFSIAALAPLEKWLEEASKNHRVSRSLYQLAVAIHGSHMHVFSQNEKHRNDLLHLTVGTNNLRSNEFGAVDFINDIIRQVSFATSLLDTDALIIFQSRITHVGINVRGLGNQARGTIYNGIQRLWHCRLLPYVYETGSLNDLLSVQLYEGTPTAFGNILSLLFKPRKEPDKSMKARMDEQQKDERETPISSYDLPTAFSQIRSANENWDDQVEWGILQDIVSG